ncbi:MAG: hypothetical protein J3K34DRAFT_254552 [Monoraphidium minutum]|nr:MAG: hypothetical protein J3K34DRAFT_254552 [Monoraphidium minutum]
MRRQSRSCGRRFAVRPSAVTPKAIWVTVLRAWFAFAGCALRLALRVLLRELPTVAGSEIPSRLCGSLVRPQLGAQRTSKAEQRLGRRHTMPPPAGPQPHARSALRSSGPASGVRAQQRLAPPAPQHQRAAAFAAACGTSTSSGSSGGWAAAPSRRQQRRAAALWLCAALGSDAGTHAPQPHASLHEAPQCRAEAAIAQPRLAPTCAWPRAGRRRHRRSEVAWRPPGTGMGGCEGKGARRLRGRPPAAFPVLLPAPLSSRATAQQTFALPSRCSSMAPRFGAPTRSPASRLPWPPPYKSCRMTISATLGACAAVCPPPFSAPSPACSRWCAPGCTPAGPRWLHACRTQSRCSSPDLSLKQGAGAAPQPHPLGPDQRLAACSNGKGE